MGIFSSHTPKKHTSVPLEELPSVAQAGSSVQQQEEPRDDPDEVMTERIIHMSIDETGSSAKIKKPRKKRGTYEKYDPVKVKTALNLVYVKKKGIPQAAEQSGIKEKTLRGLLSDLVKKHGYPPVPKVAARRTKEVRSARTDPAIAGFFEEVIKPQLN